MAYANLPRPLEQQEIETWVAALARYDNNEFDHAIAEFAKICDTSKILFNMGVIHATLGEHERAVECYQRAVRLDQYFAIAYFQQGVSNFLLGDFEEALANFNDTLLYLRGNNTIDYAQLGLLFKLYSCEVLFNRGLCYIYLQQTEAGMQDLYWAAKEKIVEEHGVIDEAIHDQAQGYTVFSIPVGVVYRPNEAKVRNLKSKDYLGKARLVAASDRGNAFTGFAGSEIKAAKSDPRDDKPLEPITFTASPLVKPGLSSRRQHSEPPVHRNVFPPTPPPEGERLSRGTSVRSSGPRPHLAKLSISTNEANRKYEKASPPQDHRPGKAPSPQDHRPSFSPQDRIRPSRSAAPPRPIAAKEPTWRQKIDEEQRGAGHEEEEHISDSYSSNEDDRRHARSDSRRPDIRRVRVKVHGDDVRYILIETSCGFAEFVERVREKMGLRGGFKIKMRDEDVPTDMITMGDQDDLDMAVESARSAALRERIGVGKMEVWVFKG